MSASYPDISVGKRAFQRRRGGEICYRQLYLGVAFMDVVVYSKLMELPGTDLQ